ncbi:4-hydroxyphenylpyruvate dioxygenase [Algibacter lectus]|uniref:4-hydroxyphenylpyruvate dioxygenase n=1 Tax=Algibacter lectus TaxID=221126 RepID=A0A090X0G1_9FLAO|nr:4-hydroxyphenylpyruvate dioxygenase [Algibacter lectus]
MSKVMSNGNGRIKFPINEPAEGKKRSQIEEYLDFYEGAGVQHIAVATDDIIKTVSQLKANGVEFLSIPPEEYYRAVPGRLEAYSHELREDIEGLKKLGIMIDADEEGICFKFSQNPWKIDRPYFLKLYNVWELKALVLVILKHFLNLLSVNKLKEAHFNFNLNHTTFVVI